MRRLLLLTALLTLAVPATADAATRWVVKGGGWGHGLGMSQYGAYGQALEGRGYRKIVLHYYRHTQLGQAAGRVRVLLLASVGSSTFGGASRVGRHERPIRAATTPCAGRADRSWCGRSAASASRAALASSA